jgi:hypothetical protein
MANGAYRANKSGGSGVCAQIENFRRTRYGNESGRGVVSLVEHGRMSDHANESDGSEGVYGPLPRLMMVEVDRGGVVW